MEKSFVELLKKKMSSGDKMDEKSVAAKREVLSDLNSQIKGLLGDKVKGLKKVTVASNSPEGLQEGLEKAQDVVEAKSGEHGKCAMCEKEPCECESEESSEHESMESPEHEQAEPKAEEQSEQESPEEKIKRLEKELADLKAQHSPESSKDEDIKNILKSAF